MKSRRRVSYSWRFSHAFLIRICVYATPKTQIISHQVVSVVCDWVIVVTNGYLSMPVCNRCRPPVSRVQAAHAVAARSGALHQTTAPQPTAPPTKVKNHRNTLNQTFLWIISQINEINLDLTSWFAPADLLNEDSSEQANLRSLTSIVDSITGTDGAQVAYSVDITKWTKDGMKEYWKRYHSNIQFQKAFKYSTTCFTKSMKTHTNPWKAPWGQFPIKFSGPSQIFPVVLLFLKMFKLASLDRCVVLWNFPQFFCWHCFFACVLWLPKNIHLWGQCFDQYLLNLTSSIKPCKYVPIFYCVNLLVYFIYIYFLSCLQ